MYKVRVLYDLFFYMLGLNIFTGAGFLHAFLTSVYRMCPATVPTR